MIHGHRAGFRFTMVALLHAGCLWTPAVASAQTIEPEAMKGMQWRQIGPFRGGRVLAVTGVAGDPNTYYFGAVAGGVWKTTHGGWTWTPLTD